MTDKNQTSDGIRPRSLSNLSEKKAASQINITEGGSATISRQRSLSGVSIGTTGSNLDNSRTLKDNELTLYYLAMRCILHPFAVIPKKFFNPNVGKQNVLLPVVRSVFVSHLAEGKNSRVNQAGLEKISTALKNYLADRDKEDHKIFINSLEKYVEFLKKDGPNVMKSDKGTITDFLDTYCKILKREVEAFPLLPTNSYDLYLKKFVKIATGVDLEPSKFANYAKKLINSEEILGIKISKDHEANINKLEDLMLTHDELQRIFSVEETQHMVVLENEKKAPFPETVLREFRVRVISVDKNPFYNKDSFIQQTGAFLQWKVKERDKVLQLAERLKAKVGKDKAIDAFEAFMDPDQPKTQDKWVGRLIITVVEARGLLAKNKKGDSNNAYCSLKLGMTSFKTRPMLNTLHPRWNEQFYFDLSDFDGQVKITVFHQSEGLLNLTEGDFLGRVTLSLQELGASSKPIEEKWFELQKRSDKSNISGQLRLKIQLMRFDRNESSDQFNYHELYNIFASKITQCSNYDLDVARKGIFVLEEFGKRYGVRRFYRRAKHLSLLIEDGEKSGYNYVAIDDAINKILHVLAGEKTFKPTHAEWDLWVSSLKILYDRHYETLCRFRTTFPLGKPDGELHALISVLKNIFDDSTFREELDLPKVEFEELVAEAVKVASKSDYATCKTNILGKEEENAQAEFPRYLSLLENLIKYMEADKNVFDPCFSGHVALCDISVPAFMNHYYEDLSSLLERRKGEVSKEVLTLFFRLQKLAVDAQQLVANRKLIPAFDFTKFYPFLVSAIDETQESCFQLSAKLTIADFQSLPKGSEYAGCIPSIPKLFAILESSFDQIKELNIPNKRQNYDLMNNYFAMVKVVTIHYSSLIESIFLGKFGKSTLLRNRGGVDSKVLQGLHFDAGAELSMLTKTLDAVRKFQHKKLQEANTWLSKLPGAENLIGSYGEPFDPKDKSKVLEVDFTMLEGIAENLFDIAVTQISSAYESKLDQLLAMNFVAKEKTKVQSLLPMQHQATEKSDHNEVAVGNYLKGSIEGIIAAFHQDAFFFGMRSKVILLLFKRIMDHYRAFVMKGILKPYSEPQMDLLLFCMRDAKDYCASIRFLNNPQFYWVNNLLEWAPVKTSVLIPQCYGALAQEEREALVCLLNSRTAKDKEAAQFMKDYAENKHRMQKYVK